uniref:Uncharacterized protein n=1 Tax=Leersia perrieri TaxID=77586 RepID=A0A0D9WQ79_9ORYZ
MSMTALLRRLLDMSASQSPSRNMLTGHPKLFRLGHKDEGADGVELRQCSPTISLTNELTGALPLLGKAPQY